MDHESQPTRDAVYSVLYKTQASRTLCTIILSPRLEGSPGLVLSSPGGVVDPGLYKMDLPAVTCAIYVEDAHNSSYPDYINAIALCMMRASITKNIVVAAESNGDGMLYCANNDCIYSSWLRPVNMQEQIRNLKDTCLGTLHRIQQELDKIAES